MKYNFDRLPERHKSAAIKWDKPFLEKIFKTADLLPMWVADMEYATAPCIREAMIHKIHSFPLGYEVHPILLTELIINWFEQYHNWKITPKSIVFTPNVISALGFLLETLSEEGEGVIIQSPVYGPFGDTIKAINRKLVENHLLCTDRGYQINFDELESLAKDKKNKVLLICSPHNPIGRVWAKSELEQMIAIAKKHDLWIVSDEIHGDIVYPENVHIPIMSIGDYEKLACITSPGKSFNLAGVTDAFAVINHARTRRLFYKKLVRYFLFHANAMANTAMMSAYKDGREWLDELLLYLNENKKSIGTFLEKEMPRVKHFAPEGTFLYWMDFSDYGLDPQKLLHQFTHVGKIGLNPGTWFGKESGAFMRLNFATSKAMLEEGLSRIKLAMDKL